MHVYKCPAAILSCLTKGEYRPCAPPLPPLQASEEYFVCAWSVDEASGAPLLLLAGKKGLLLAVNALRGALEVRPPGAGFVCSLHLAGGCKCLRTMPLQAPYPVGCLQAPCKQLQHEWHQTNVC